MKHLYKKNKYYFYKRRLPYSDRFFSFNTCQSNYKKAVRIVIIFNSLAKDLFHYLKTEGKDLIFDQMEIAEVLDKYKIAALKEYNVIEEKRHVQIGKLLGITKEIPILGTQKLNAGHPDVITKALEFFEYLAVCNYFENKVQMKKHGKDIITRGTAELKELYSKYRASNDETDLLNLLSMLFKAEAAILQKDLHRANCRFGKDTQVNNSDNNFKNDEFNSRCVTIKSIGENFLNTSFSKEELNDSKRNGYKVSSMVSFLVDCSLDKYKVEYIDDLNEKIITYVFGIIQKIPKKRDNGTDRRSFYYQYLKQPNLSYKNDLKAQSTLHEHIKGLFRFIEYLYENNHLAQTEFNNLKRVRDKEVRLLAQAVNNGLLNGKIDVEPFKDEMIKAIFNKNNNPYKILFEKIEKLEEENKDDLIMRFYCPLIMFFIGSRLEEVVHLKINDCEITQHEEREKLKLYLEANENKNQKNNSSKRIVVVHDFLSHDLNLINFVKKAKREDKDFLFNVEKNADYKVSKEFNRKKDFLEGNLDRDDEFKNARYSLYSFRHSYKTHMTALNINSKIIDKIQGHKNKDSKVADGYLSLSDELNENINRFNKHKIVDWTDFLELTRKICL